MTENGIFCCEKFSLKLVKWKGEKEPHKFGMGPPLMA